jgi:acyl transferase domain-containing protein
MAAELFERRGSFYRRAMVIDEMLREYLGLSVVAAVYEPGRKVSDWFDRLTLTYPAVFLVECALAGSLLDVGLRPDRVVSVSMGVYAALVASESLSLSDAVLAVSTQAQLLQAHCSNGGLLAVPGLRLEQAEAFAKDFDCDLATINVKSPCVVAVDSGRLQSAEAELRLRGANPQRLMVSKPFHSRWVEGAREACTSLLSSVQLRRPEIPVYCCVDERAVGEFSASYLWRLIREPIRFDATVEVLCQEIGARFVDVGPSGTLATALRHYKTKDRGGEQYEVQMLLSPFGGAIGRFEQLLGNGCEGI